MAMESSIDQQTKSIASEMRWLSRWGLEAPLSESGPDDFNGGRVDIEKRET
jgi:hypothetical protein